MFQEVLDSVKASNALNRVAYKLKHIKFMVGINLTLANAELSIQTRPFLSSPIATCTTSASSSAS